MDLNRRENETPLQHHKRLLDGKLTDKTLADIDYSELSEYVYGQSYSSDVARRMMYGSKKTLDLLEDEKRLSVSDQDLVGEIDMRMLELQKERQKFYDQRMAFTKIVREQARNEEIIELIRDCLTEGKLPELKPYYADMPRGDADSTMLVSLNDMHYGAFIDNAWCKYSSDVCADMLDLYLNKIRKIASVHQCRDCVVWAAGDFISGNIHRSIQVTNKENVIEQVMGASELIAHFLSALSGIFETVRFVSVSGNHSRIEPNKNDALSAERLDDIVEWYLAARLQNFDNIIINDEHRIDRTISVFDIQGKKYCMVHGDFDVNRNSIQSLQSMIRTPIYAVLSGHMHHNQTDVVQGIRTIMAGSFEGMDSYCVEKRIFGEPEQMVCVCDDDGVACHYDISLRMDT